LEEQSQQHPGQYPAKSVVRGLKHADNRNAGSMARQALVGESSGIDSADLDRRDELRKSRGDDARPALVGDGSIATSDAAPIAPDESAASGAASSDEDEFIRASLANDEDAFEKLVRRHSPRVFSIIGSFFRRRDQIEDIAQEVFSKAYFSLATFTLGRSFEAWVARIAVNACYDHLRAQRRRIEQQLPHETQQEDEWFELQMLEVARDRHASAERQRDAGEIAERLLSKLDPEDRLVVILIDRDGFSVKEVSDMTGWGQSKVKVRAFRARRVLRAAMKRLVLSGERMQRSKKQ
jgi:RNA polymerase sigma-70 factor (ECF subfamily)